MNNNNKIKVNFNEIEVYLKNLALKSVLKSKQKRLLAFFLNSTKNYKRANIF